MIGHPMTGAAIGVSILVTSFSQPSIDVLKGDTVTWSNDSNRQHTVVAADGSFASPTVFSGDTFAHEFDATGTMPYYCSIHPFMRGEVDVHSLLLDAPAGRAGSGKPFVISGRAAADVTGSLTIEGDDGSGFRRAATAAVAADGTFRTTVTPDATTTYRAVSGDRQSPPVQVLVLDHAVTVRTRRHGRSTTVMVRVTPADPGAPVVLQLRSRDRFGWWPVARARLGASSTATFRIARRSVAPGRVLLTLPDGATELARSRTVRVGPFVRR
jgi:plastocyanin